MKMPVNIQPETGRHGLSARGGASAAAVAWALLTVYIVWGTTYFALSLSLADMPPVLMNGLRFLLAGAVMLGVAAWQGLALPTPTQWRNAAVVGGLMAFGAMTLVAFAQKLGIGSGLMATVVATMPFWLTLWSRLGGERAPNTSWAALALGALGALLLAHEGDFSASLLGGLLAFAAPLCWSLGSYASRKLDLPPPAMASAAEWLVAGALGTAVGLLAEGRMGLQQMGHASAAAWVAWLYLVVFGSIAFNAYLWLLKHTPAALAGSYAFVNPAVALLVGVALGGEVLTGWVFAALPLILAALALLLWGELIMAWLRRQCHRLQLGPCGPSCTEKYQ